LPSQSASNKNKRKQRGDKKDIGREGGKEEGAESNSNSKEKSKHTPTLNDKRKEGREKDHPPTTSYPTITCLQRDANKRPASSKSRNKRSRQQ
jgi:hypothetical protein